MVEFIPGFARVRCIIGNDESGVIISDLTLDQCFYTHKEEVPYGVSCFNVLSWTFWIVLELSNALHCPHSHSLCIVHLFHFASFRASTGS